MGDNCQNLQALRKLAGIKGHQLSELTELNFFGSLFCPRRRAAVDIGLFIASCLRRLSETALRQSARRDGSLENTNLA